MKIFSAVPWFYCLVFLFGCSKQEQITEKDVEYRKNKDGSLTLFALGDSKPFASGRVGYVNGYHDSKDQKKFSIGFSNGLKHGPFTFWYSNGVMKLTGTYTNGQKDGIFQSYGQAGELISVKNYSLGELDGNFSLFYPLSKSEVRRYFDTLESHQLKPADLHPGNHLRFECRFSQGIPVGRYRTYYHPEDYSVSSPDELLKEEGYFSENGELVGDQYLYYPRTKGLVVFLPNGENSEIIHPANVQGLSTAIVECSSALEEIPAYRNPEKIPAKVFAIDRQGNRIAPIWSSDLVCFAVRNSRGFLDPKRFPPSYESYRKEAIPYASQLVTDPSQQNQPESTSSNSVEVVGLNDSGEVVDIVWSSSPRAKVISLESRINLKRKRISRVWDSGKSDLTEWFTPLGMRMILRADSVDDSVF
jgi:antitoxin component YwqK of YwqJK toxin-antitoxin module